MAGKYKTTEYYTSVEEVQGAYMRALLAVPGLHLDEQELAHAARVLSNALWADPVYTGKVRKDSANLELADKIKNMVAGLSEVGATKRECLEILRKNSNCFDLYPQTVAVRVLALTEIYQTFPETVAPRDAYLIKNQRAAFESVCRSSGIRGVVYSLATIAKYRRYIELVASGDIVHEHFMATGGYKLAIFRMPLEELDKRLADCEARMARGEGKPVAAAKPARTFRTAAGQVKTRKPAPKPAAQQPAPRRPTGVDNHTAEGRAALAKLMAARLAAKKP